VSGLFQRREKYGLSEADSRLIPTENTSGHASSFSFQYRAGFFAVQVQTWNQLQLDLFHDVPYA
jgi:hypothetical protein